MHSLSTSLFSHTREECRHGWIVAEPGRRTRRTPRPRAPGDGLVRRADRAGTTSVGVRPGRCIISRRQALEFIGSSLDVARCRVVSETSALGWNWVDALARGECRIRSGANRGTSSGIKGGSTVKKAAGTQARRQKAPVKGEERTGEGGAKLLLQANHRQHSVTWDQEPSSLSVSSCTIISSRRSRLRGWCMPRFSRCSYSAQWISSCTRMR